MTSEPAELGDYLLESCVARGGMGEIWRARERVSGRPVAIKRILLAREQGVAQALRARLLREMQAVRQVQHANLVEYLGSGFDEAEQPYLVLEWLEGEDLARRQLRQRLTLSEAVEVVRQALQGLAACHERGIVHRDIKPGNLFLLAGEGGAPRVKVVDLGLAYLVADDATRLTIAGEVVGTLLYLSPEQARGAGDLDHRTDVYSMGVVLYELATGTVPFHSANPLALLLKVVTETPPRPREIRSDIPMWVEEAIVRAMQRDSTQRFASAVEMAQALRPPESRAFSVVPPQACVDQTLPGGLGGPSVEQRLVSLLYVLPDLVEERGLEALSAPIAAAGGEMQRLVGGTVVGLFGLERSLGDEAMRAVQAGMAIRHATGRGPRLLAATARLEVGLGLRFATGSLDSAASELPRLPAGELFLDGATQELVRRRVETREVNGRIVVTGLASEVLSRSVLFGKRTPTTGRESEVAAIRAAHQRVVQSAEPELVLAVAEAGMGKSRICQELLPELREGAALCLEARTYSSTAKSAFSLFADGISRAAGIQMGSEEGVSRQMLAQLVARFVAEEKRKTVCVFLAEAMGLASRESIELRVARGDPKVMRERVSSAFEELFAGAGERGPVVLVLEDLHWADPESLKLCERLLERLERTPLLILATCRPSLLEARPGFLRGLEVTRVDLHPLGPRAMRRLVQAALGSPAPRELEELLIKWCDGNPYFAEELLTWMINNQVVTRSASGWSAREELSGLELPVGIEETIQGRLDALAPELKELLKSAAVFGEVFWEEGCDALGFAGASLLLERIARAELVRRRASSSIAGTNEWEFRNSLLHQVAGRMLPEERVPLLHLRAAQWLEQKGERDPAVLARHYELAREEALAARSYALAAERSFARGDVDGAVERFKQALACGQAETGISDRGASMLGLARALMTSGRYQEAEMALDELGAFPGIDEHPTLLGELHFRRGRLCLGRGSLGQAAEALDKAGGLLARDPASELNFEVRNTLFWVHWMRGDYQEARRTADLLSVAAHWDGLPDHQCAAKLALAYANAAGGDLSASVRLAAEARDHARDMGHPYRELDCLVFLGSVEEQVGLYQESRGSLEAALALAVRLKVPHSQAGVETCLGRLALSTSALESALAHQETAIELAERLQDQRTLAIALAARSRILQRRGGGPALLEAEEGARRALSLAAEHAPTVEAEARMALAEVYLAQSRNQEACAEALAATAVLERLGPHELHEVEILLVAHDAQQAAGRSGEAAALLDRARQSLEQQAGRIADPAVRRSFTQNVPANRRVSTLP